MFGRRNKKIEYDARKPPKELLQSPQNYSYVHNFKVHFKSSALQVLANKLDVSVNTDSPSLPCLQLVTSEFNNRMIVANAHTNTRVRFDASSFHITNIEYKESIALKYSVSKNSMPQPQVADESAFCPSCGNQLVSGSKFCNKCGTQL